MVFQSLFPKSSPLKDNSAQHLSYGSLQQFDDKEKGDDGGDEESCESDTVPPFPQEEPTLMTEVTDEVSVISNTISALLGVSLFAMPWGFQQSGILGGLFILFVVSFLSYDTARMLLISQKALYLRTGHVKNYPQIAATTLGPAFSWIVKIATITSCLGGCTGYLIFFGETVGQALSIPSHSVILYATIPLVLLSWVRTFKELSIFTLIGVGSLITAVIMILVDGSHKIDAKFYDLPLVAPDTFMNFIGPATFLFTIHYCILSMGAEALKTIPWINSMANHEPELSFSALNYPIAISYSVSLIIIALVGVAGFAMYRNVDLVT
jgi:amino acid permease